MGVGKCICLGPVQENGEHLDQSINQHFIGITLRIRYSHLQLKTKLQTNNRVINALQGGNPI